MNKTEKRDQMLDGLQAQHELYISYGVDDIHVHRVTQFTLSEIMKDIVDGESMLFFPSMQVEEDGEWHESYTTVFLQNVHWIEWPEQVIRDLHDDANRRIEDLVDTVLDEEDHEGDEGEA